MKLLFIDIETTPAFAAVWALHNQNISVDQIIKPTSVLCFAASWWGSKEIIFHKSHSREGRDFERMIKHAHRLLQECDAVCHFNGERFDIPRLNIEFLRYDLRPTPPIHQIDLKKVVWQKFGPVSSKLKFLAPYLQIGKKVENEGWKLWLDCLENDADAWRRMEEYNIGDVRLLPRLYKKIRGWIPNHPNMNLFVDHKDPVCPNCGSKDLKRNDVRRTLVYVYERYFCRKCGAWCRARLSSKKYGRAERR